MLLPLLLPRPKSRYDGRYARIPGAQPSVAQPELLVYCNYYYNSIIYYWLINAVNKFNAINSLNNYF